MTNRSGFYPFLYSLQLIHF